MGRNIVLLLLLATANTACGAMGQYFYGFTERAERTATRTRPVRIADLPADAHVDRVEPNGALTPMKGRTDLVSYAVHETVEVPRSRVPMYLGTALDLVGVGGFGYWLANGDEDTRSIAAYGLVYAVSALIADLAFSIYYSIDQEEIVVGYEPAESKRVTYVGYYGDDVRRATIDVAVQDRVSIDFTQPQDPGDVMVRRTEPGGPRIAATVPKPPPAPVASIPLPRTDAPPEPPEQWYGWQTMPLDLLSAVGLLYGASTENWDLMLGAGVGHLTAVPALHLIHGQTETAGASIGLRLGTAVGGGVLGALMGVIISPIILLYGGGDPGFFEIVGLAAAYTAGVGFVAGSPIVAILDGAALAWEPETEPTLKLIPSAGRTDTGSPTFGIGGTF